MDFLFLVFKYGRCSFFCGHIKPGNCLVIALRFSVLNVWSALLSFVCFCVFLGHKSFSALLPATMFVDISIRTIAGFLIFLLLEGLKYLFGNSNFRFSRMLVFVYYVNCVLFHLLLLFFNSFVLVPHICMLFSDVSKRDCSKGSLTKVKY